MPFHFDAPWSRWLTAITALLLGVAAWAAVGGYHEAAGVMAALLLVTAALSVRGYAVEPGAVRVLRPGRTTDLSLRGLESVEVDEGAMRRSWRVFGMGGPFALVGWFRSGAVGPFRAYATDPKRAVVLRWADRAVVVTPDDPAAFVAAVEASAEGV